MGTRGKLPPYEIVSTEDASHAAATRLHIHVAISPEDSAWIGQVTREVVTTHAGANDVVMVFFHATEEAVRRGEPARVTAQYVRHDMRRDFRPEPLTSPQGTIEIETRDGLIIVERERNV